MPPTQRSGNNNNNSDGPSENESKFTQSGANNDVNDIILTDELSNLDRGSIIVSQHDYTGVGNIYIPMVYM